jgi:ferredoxin
VQVPALIFLGELMKIYNIYFSPTRSTEKIANYFSSYIDMIDIDLTVPENRNSLQIESDSVTVLSIPTYSQNVPIPLRNCLKKIESKSVVVNVTYGGLSYGNLVYEIMKLLPKSTLIGYSITPVKHSYLDKTPEINFEEYNILINRIKNQDFQERKAKYRVKNIFSNILEKWRTKYNYKIVYESSKCNQCNECIQKCPTTSINQDYKISKNCIRCSRCVTVCPNKALIAKISLPLKIYLLKKAKTNIIIC